MSILLTVTMYLVGLSFGRSGASGGFSIENGYSEPYIVQNSNHKPILKLVINERTTK